MLKSAIVVLIWLLAAGLRRAACCIVVAQLLLTARVQLLNDVALLGSPLAQRGHQVRRRASGRWHLSQITSCLRSLILFEYVSAILIVRGAAILSRELFSLISCLRNYFWLLGRLLLIVHHLIYAAAQMERSALFFATFNLLRGATRGLASFLFNLVRLDGAATAYPRDMLLLTTSHETAS